MQEPKIDAYVKAVDQMDRWILQEMKVNEIFARVKEQPRVTPERIKSMNTNIERAKLPKRIVWEIGHNRLVLR